MVHGSRRDIHWDSADATRRVDDAWLSSALDGTPRNDRLTGTADGDFFDVSQGGNDTVRGLGGDDDVVFGNTFDAKDQLVGGAGFDSIELSGTYANLTVTGAMLSGVEFLYLSPGGVYNLTLSQEVGTGLDYLEVYVDSATSAVSRATITASALTAPMLWYGSAGDDVFVSGAGNDLFRVKGGGDDVYDGGGGYNRISLYGVADGIAFDLGATGAQSVGNGTVTIRNIADVSGTAGADTLTGSAADNWILGNGGNDTLIGLGGDDYLIVGAAVGGGNYPTAASVDGGRGFDTLDLNSNGQADGGVTFSLDAAGFQDTGQGMIKAVGIEAVSGTGFDDTLTGDKLANTLFGGGGVDTLSGGTGDDILYGDGFYAVSGDNGFDGPRVIIQDPADAFDDVLNGGKGNDTLIGGGGADTLTGGADADTLTGGLGADLFVYQATAESAGKSLDRIVDFTSGADRIDVSAIDANTGARGNQAFHLGATAGHAGDIVFQYDSTTDTTVVTLYVNADANADMTINLTGNIALTANDFVL